MNNLAATYLRVGSPGLVLVVLDQFPLPKKLLGHASQYRRSMDVRLNGAIPLLVGQRIAAISGEPIEDG